MKQSTVEKAKRLDAGIKRVNELIEFLDHDKVSFDRYIPLRLEDFMGFPSLRESHEHHRSDQLLIREKELFVAALEKERDEWAEELARL